MAIRGLTLCLALLVPAATMAQPVAAPEKWTPTSTNAKAVTGPVIFAPTEISFQNGKSLSLVPEGHMLFRPAAKQKKVLAELYKVASLDGTIQLCSKEKPAAYLIVWKPEVSGKGTEPRTLAPFSGPKLNAGSPDDCGRYLFDAVGH